MIADRTLQGAAIAAALRNEGYLILKRSSLSWQVTEQGQEWWALVAFLPRPVNEWRVLPTNSESHTQQLYQIISSVI